MSETTASARSAGGKTSVLPARRRFSVDEYHRMAEAGILGPDERVELLEGVIYTMAAMGSRHAGRISFADRWFGARLAGRAIVRAQSPVQLSSGSEPEPDLALVRPRPEDPDYDRAHPGPADVLLVVEIADTSLAHDRDLKLPLYAAAGIPEAWLVDLTSDRVLIHREPSATGYRSISTAGRGDVLAPAAFPDLQLAVADLLPG